MELVNENTLRLLLDHTTNLSTAVKLSKVDSFFNTVVTDTKLYRAAVAIKADTITDPCKTLIDMCLKKENEAVKWIIETYNLTYEQLFLYDSNILKYLSHDDNIKLFEYACNKFRLSISDLRRENSSVVKWSSLRGYTNVLRYILFNFSLTREDIAVSNCRAMRWAQQHGHTHIVELLESV